MQRASRAGPRRPSLSAPPFTLSEAEWLALLPDDRVLRSVPVPLSTRPLPDPAERLRAENPLTPPVTRAQLTADGYSWLSPSVHAAYFVSRAPPFHLFFGLAASFAVPLCAAFSAQAVVAVSDPEGRFGTRQIAAGTAACVLTVLCYGIPFLIPILTGSAPPGRKPGAHVDSSLWVSGAYIRWRQLFAGPTPSRLVEHAPGDRLCPCALPSCSGRWFDWDLAFRAVLAPRDVVMRGLVAVLQLWTLAVTFGGRSWTTPWTAFVMCLAVAAWVPTAAAVTFSVGALVDMPPGIRASGKLQCRAMKLVLVDLLARYRAALLPERGEPLDGEAEENKDDKPAPSMGCDAAHDLDGATEGEDYYVTLHSYLRGIWRGKLMFSLQRAILTSYGTAICISLVLNAAAGSCIPLWILVFLLSTLIGVFADLLRLADHNAQPELVSSLLRDAALEARSILLRAPPGPLPDRLARHATVLSSLADPQAHHRGTFLGIVVGYGVVRAVFATTATLLLAAWTVARAFGLVVVLDALCPGPG